MASASERRRKSSGMMTVTKLRSELIVIGAPRRRRPGSVFGSTVEHVLKRAQCRVMFIGSAPIAVYSAHAAA